MGLIPSWVTKGLPWLVKNPPALRDTWVRPLSQEGPLEKGKATHSSVLAWRMPWAASTGSQRVGHDWATVTFTLGNWDRTCRTSRLKEKKIKINKNWGRSQDGRGIGWGDHFLPYKFIKRTIERRANFRKQLLIASWGHQAPRKAAHCLRREVGQNIKDKKRQKS